MKTNVEALAVALDHSQKDQGRKFRTGREQIRITDADP
jgi:hypothetical protein